MTCPLKPMEFNVVVEMDPTESVTKGGIILVESQKERDKLAAEEGVLVASSPHAFTYASDWPEDYPPPQVGQRVLIKRYQGIIREHGGKDYRIVSDKDILAVVPEGGKE